MRNLLSTWFLGVVILFYTFLSFASDWKTKIPEFTNTWTIKNNIEYYYAGCRGNQLVYKNTSNSPELLALNAPYEKQDDPSQKQPHDCSWRVIGVQQGLWKPETFPGTYDEWSIIEETISTQRPVTQIYSRACYSETGEEKGRDEIRVYPIYQCPEGTETRDDGWSQGPFGCFLNRELCLGDVVARDLNSSLLWYVGHIGIVTEKNSEITEVLNNDEYPYSFWDSSKVIQLNNFHSFAFNTDTKFWGAAYNAIKSGYLDFWAENKVRSAAYDQYRGGFYIARYTLLPIAKPYQEKKYYFYDRYRDKFLEDYGSTAPWFRCDTFVKYIYENATGDSLTSSNKFLTPKKIYNAFVNIRQIYPENVNRLFNLKPANDLYYKEISCDNIDCYMNEIEVLINENRDINTIYKYLKKIKEISAKQTMSQDNNFYDLLYRLRTKFPFRLDVYKITLDTMSEDDAFSYIPWLIHDYKKLQADDSDFSKKARLHILSIFYDSLLLDDNQIKNITKTDKQTIINLQDLIISILQYTNDKREGMQAIFVASNILGYGARMYTDDTRNRLHLSDKEEVKNHLEFFDIKQNIYNELLNGNNLVELKLKFDTKKLNEVLFTFVRNIDVNDLNSSSKIALKNYLKQIEPNNPVTFKQEYSNYVNYLKTYVEWFDAYTRLLPIDENTKNTLYLKKLMSFNNAHLSAFLFLSQKSNRYQWVNKTVLNNYLQYLNRKYFKHSKITKNDNKLVNQAIANINYLLKMQDS